MANPNSPLKVALIGGGIVSLCLAHALSTNPNIDIKIFEKSNVLREEGASVGLGPNAQNALSQISPELRQAVDDAGGVPCDPLLRVMLVDDGEGKLVHDVRLKQTQFVVYWGALHRELYKRIPEGCLQLGKGVTGVEEMDDGHVRVQFDDGSFYDADAVVGCDGINSNIRRAVLGADSPAVNAMYTEHLCLRVVVPIEEAREAFGDEYCSLLTQYGWMGDRVFLLTDHANDGAAMQVIADFGMDEEWPHEMPFAEWPKEKMRESLKRCGKIGQAMTKIYDNQPKLYAACLRVHPETATFFKGRICLAGDAALAFSPAHGAGAGQAVEDAMILAAVMNECKRRKDIAHALEIYDSIRRPRRTMVGELSGWAWNLWHGKDPHVKLDPERILERVRNWGAPIYNYDCAAAQKEAVDRMRQTAGMNGVNGVNGNV